MIVASALVAIYVALGLIHVYWGFGGRSAWIAAVPEVNGHAAFTPPPAATFFVAAVLFAFAALVAATAGLIAVPLPDAVLVRLAQALAAIMMMRAVGDFRLVGFFKRVKGTKFARMDTLLYSPLCLLLAAGVFLVAWQPRG